MHKCFISSKKEDAWYKQHIIDLFGKDYFIDKSLDKTIESLDGDYVMEVIRRDYLRDSTVTLFIIGTHSSEMEGKDWLGDKNYFIKRELAASLFNGRYNTRNGILGVVLPNMYSEVYRNEYVCQECGKTHQYIAINDSTTIREFSYNYYIEPHDGCAWSEEERYCVLVKWDDFLKFPEKYIDQAFDKRYSEITAKIRIRNLR